MSDAKVSDNAIVIERTFGAPVAFIWQLWTDPEHFKNWYGPNGFTVPVAEMDLQVGGKRLICMVSPDGNHKMWTTGEFTEITPTSRLAYTESMSDENGNIIEMEGDYPTTTTVIVELEDDNGRTKMTMTHAGVPADSPGASGWNQAFDKLTAYVQDVQ